jgi:hypothetical protein
MDAHERLDQRRRAHHALATRLAGMSDASLAALLTEPDPSHASMNGNASEAIEVEGAKVFVKKIALTDLERSPGAHGATANLFNLPLFCRYELAFGAWRELSACLRASAWALSGECGLFPIVHHWRVLPRRPTPGDAEREARLQRALDHWERSEAIAARVEALWGASASLVLFVEHVPKMLLAWLADRSGAERPDAAMEMEILRTHDEWRRAAAFMNERGLLHFDLHRANLLTDGVQIYVGDYGLALCDDFDLRAGRARFLRGPPALRPRLRRLGFRRVAAPRSAAAGADASARGKAGERGPCRRRVRALHRLARQRQQDDAVSHGGNGDGARRNGRRALRVSPASSASNLTAPARRVFR